MRDINPLKLISCLVLVLLIGLASFFIIIIYLRFSRPITSVSPKTQLTNQAPTGLPSAAFTPSPAIKLRGGLKALYRSGQTFLTWPEINEVTDEIYRVYRSSAPIQESSLSQARLLAEVGKNSSRIWANYANPDVVYQPRLTDRMIIENGTGPLANDSGALVWTLDPEDFGGASQGSGYYAVTVTYKGTEKGKLLPGYSTGPIKEAVADPLPVEISHSPGIQPGPGGHYYLQFMDLRHWNPTYHAPNKINDYLGFNPKDPNVQLALAYIYDYAIFEPTPDLCGGKVPDTLPVMIFLHGARMNRYGNPDNYPYPYCAYGIYPIDESDTWYFGFARHHDYRKEVPFDPEDVIENFTERRILRMLYDLMRNPPGPPVDSQRLYLFGHPMGGTGSLAFAERYPNVFAAIYSGQPVTYFRATEGVDEPWPAKGAQRWGPQEMNLPVFIAAPGGWADHLQKYNGVGVFDWQNLRAAFDPSATPNRRGEDMVPFGIDHGTIDDSVQFPSQGKPLYPLLLASPRTWAGAINESEHKWSVFGWPLADLSKKNDVPFYNLRVIRDETVPGFSNLSTNRPDDIPTTFNQTVLWSASWNAWDGKPVDTAGEWQMSFCAVAPGEQKCASGQDLTVDITPRRLQHFVVTPGKEYTWENIDLRSKRVIASGTFTADADGLITVQGVRVSAAGNRLRIRPR